MSHKLRSHSRRNTAKGSSPDLMPSIMGAIDELLEAKDAKLSCKKNSFPNLSANVQKMLSHLPDEDAANPTVAAAAAEIIIAPPKRNVRARRSFYNCNKSNEALDLISTNVQKMLSNLPDTELVIVSGDEKSFNETTGFGEGKRFEEKSNLNCISELNNNNSGYDEASDNNNSAVDEGLGRPLGSYLQKSSGIASRRPVGRKNMGKYLQIPSESTNSTLSEASRPVSLTSLGSCSSSSSSGLHQQGSAYLASAESLDSDNEPNGSQGSADSGIAESTTMGPDMRVLQEVLDTEAVYVDDLHHVITGYLEPWRNDPLCPLTEHLAHLFSNLEAIHNFNRNFLNQLNATNSNPTQVANVFLQNDKGFSIYTEYCTNYPVTMNILTELTRDERMAALFRERQTALRHALPLGSYLLKPVQRILKYHVLLQRLSKQCESEHKPSVDLALATMTGVATHINTMKRKHEHAVRVQEIQSQLYGWNGPDLTALGELIAEGIFRVGGARSRRHVFLFDKLLMMAKSKSDGVLAYKSHIMCSNLMLVEQVRGEPLSFHVLPFDNPRNQCTLRARNPHHKREWTLQIKRVILENYNAIIPNHARQLVMQLGQEVQDNISEQSNKSSPIKQHSTPQYLERRGRIRKSQLNRRALSQDRTFPSLTSWRRKSDPSGCPPEQNKPCLKKTHKLKKPHTVFYTDLSDSENCDVTATSVDSLNVIQEHNNKSSLYGENPFNTRIHTANSIAQVVSDLLMQSDEFQKLLKKRRKNNVKLENSKSWNSQDERLPNKSDSLPRSFQLSETKPERDGQNLGLSESLNSLQGSVVPESPDANELDCEYQENEEEHPEHRIYRKSSIRFSLLQRFRAIMTDDSKLKLPTYKQGSKGMGAKLANPEYADPQKVILLHATGPPSLENDKIDFHYDLLESTIDMTINEAEVLKEIDRRLSQKEASLTTANQSQRNELNAADASSTLQNSNIIFSSQNSESSYYESLLDKRLTEEESKIEKSDSFRSTSEDTKTINYKKPEVKRPNRAPPPIPAKPKFLSTTKVSDAEVSLQSCSSSIRLNAAGNSHQKGWVKTIVDRFE